MGTQSINKLDGTDSIGSGDSFAIDKRSAGGDRKIPYDDVKDQLAEDILEDVDHKDAFVKQYSTPTTGATITVTDGSDDDSNIWLIITPSGALADLEIKLPAIASVVDLQEILVICTKAITSLTFDANGATSVIGAPSSLSANESFKLKMDILSTNKTWYNIQNPS
jgi:hypothetical protein